MYKILKNLIEMDDYSVQRLSKSSSVIDYIWYKLWGKTIQTLLPSEYQQVDYIESTGTQYIDTGVITGENTTIELDFKSNKTAGQAFQSLFGTQKSANEGRLYILFGSSNNYQVNIPRNNTSFAGLYENGTVSKGLQGDWFTTNRVNYILDVKNKEVKIGDKSWDLSVLTGDYVAPTYNLYLLTRNNAGVADTDSATGFLYGSKIYNNNTLVRNLVPCYRKSDNEVGMYDLVNNVFYTNDGTGSFTYGSVVPTPSNPVEVKGVGDRTGNLFDKANATYKNGYYKNDNGVEQTTQNSGYLTSYISVKPNATYTIQGKLKNTDSPTHAYAIYYYNDSKQWISRVVITDNPPYTFTTPNDCYFIQFQYRQEVYDENTIQIEEGSTATSYKPYGYKIPIVCDNEIKNIYLNEPLHKINDYADILSYSEQGVVRKIKKLVLTGDEEWAYITGSKHWTPVTGYQKSGLMCTCSHYEAVKNSSGSGMVTNGQVGFYSSAANRLIFCNTNYTTTEDWKTYLAQQYANGTPVTVWYVLDTEETEQIKAPDILANKYTSITVDTEVQPSQVDFTTKGKKVEPTNVSSRVSTLNTTNIDNTLGLDDTLNTYEFEPMEKEDLTTDEDTTI